MKYVYEKLYLCIKQYLRLTLDLELQTINIFLFLGCIFKGSITIAFLNQFYKT